MPPTKVGHANTVCNMCGTNKTWIWYKNKDENRKWDGKSYLCDTCYREYKKPDHYEKIKEEYFVKKKSLRKHKKCCICGSSNTYIIPNGIEQWYSHQCLKDGCSRHICKDCYSKEHNKNDPRTIMSNWRHGQLSRYSTSGKGFIGTQIVAKMLGVDDCNIIMNNFRFYIDLSKHSKYGYVEVKIATFKNGMWQFNIKREQKYDNLILVCMDENRPWQNVIMVLIIPIEEVFKHGKSITIYEKPSRSVWYERFITEEKIFNDKYHEMKIKRCDVLRKDE